MEFVGSNSSWMIKRSASEHEEQGQPAKETWGTHAAIIQVISPPPLSFVQKHSGNFLAVGKAKDCEPLSALAQLYEGTNKDLVITA
jgi:hypothetical protein